MGDRMPCLLLIKSGTGSNPEGYALINRTWHCNKIISLLSATAPVVTHEQFDPPQNAKFDLIEVWQQFAVFAQNAAAERYVPRLYVDDYNLDIVRRLFPAGSNIKLITRFRIDHNCELQQMFTALSDENLKTIEKLLLAGADINWRRAKGGTTLAHFAAERKAAPLIALLSQCRVNLNGDGDKNPAPLHVAVKKNDVETVKALLDHGADIDVKAANGSSALSLATKAGLPEMVKLLTDRGALADAKIAG